MTEETRKYIIAGSIGLGAVAVLVVISRSGSTAPGTTQPAAPAPSNPLPITMPSFPAVSFNPAPITIIESPTFNAPGPRPSFFPDKPPSNDDAKPTDACACHDKCKDSGGYTPLTNVNYNTMQDRLSIVERRSYSVHA